MPKSKERVALMTYYDADGKDCGSTAKPGLSAIMFQFVEKTGVDADGKNLYGNLACEVVDFESIGEVSWESWSADGLKQKVFG